MKKVFLILSIAIIVGGVVFYFDQREEESQEKGSNNISQEVSKDEAVQRYLEESEEFNKPSFGGKSFVAYKKLGEKSEVTFTEQYLWVFAQEYFLKDGILQKGTGFSVPALLIVVDNRIDRLRLPRDGSLYIRDLQEMFPNEVLGQPIFSSTDMTYHNQLVQELSQDVEDQARLFFRQ